LEEVEASSEGGDRGETVRKEGEEVSEEPTNVDDSEDGSAGICVCVCVCVCGLLSSTTETMGVDVDTDGNNVVEAVFSEFDGDIVSCSRIDLT
jgi:hypothetical protein